MKEEGGGLRPKRNWNDKNDNEDEENSIALEAVPFDEEPLLGDEGSHQSRVDSDSSLGLGVEGEAEGATSPFHDHFIMRKIKELKIILISGVGFFSDAYDLFVINIVLLLLAHTRTMSSADKSLVSTAVLVGALCGQLVFGLVADKLGRKKGFVVTLSLVIAGTICSSFVYDLPPFSIFVVLAFVQFFLGIGIGGEYPLSATITVESSKTASRGRSTAAVFSMQGVGALAAAVVSFIVVSALPHDLDLAWRVCIGVGAIPGLASLYFRFTMEETKQFQQRTTKPDYWGLFKRHWGSLLGTAGTWFIFDITFYANGLFSATILDEMKLGTEHGSEDDQVQELITICKFNIFLTAVALPGYWVATWLIETSLGRKNLQVVGFACITFLYLFLGVVGEVTTLSWEIMLTAYAFSFFFSNLGPNTTTYVLSAETFPTEIRATCHGLSAAAGKLGAVIGAASLSPILDAYGLAVVFIICGVVAGLGCIITVAFVKETKGQSLEKISGSRPPDSIN